MAAWYYFAKPTNLAFHDMTTTIKPPRNLRALLGLGMKFIPTPRLSHSKAYLSQTDTATLPTFYRDLQLRIFFAGEENEDEESNEYNPRMYLKSKWTPPPWTITKTVEKRYAAFTTELESVFKKQRGRNNLLPHQRDTLQWLQTQDDFAIINCDKNLGPAIIEKHRYCQMVLNHLQYTPGAY